MTSKKFTFVEAFVPNAFVFDFGAGHKHRYLATQAYVQKHRSLLCGFGRSGEALAIVLPNIARRGCGRGKQRCTTFAHWNQSLGRSSPRAAYEQYTACVVSEFAVFVQRSCHLCQNTRNNSRANWRREFFGLWLSLVERLVRDQEAVGSNPTSPITFSMRYTRAVAAAIGRWAQILPAQCELVILKYFITTLRRRKTRRRYVGSCENFAHGHSPPQES